MPIKVAWAFSLKNKITSLETCISCIPLLFLPRCFLNFPFVYNLLFQWMYILIHVQVGFCACVFSSEKSSKTNPILKLFGVFCSLPLLFFYDTRSPRWDLLKLVSFTYVTHGISVLVEWEILLEIWNFLFLYFPKLLFSEFPPHYSLNI